MDWLALGTLIAGSLGGYTLSGLRRARRLAVRAEEERRKEGATLPRCLCGHWFNQHVAGGGRCLTGSNTTTEQFGDSYSTLRKIQTTSQCDCIGYIGPDPMICGYWQGNSLINND